MELRTWFPHVMRFAEVNRISAYYWRKAIRAIRVAIEHSRVRPMRIFRLCMGKVKRLR
jgi:hypothetical protein